MTVLLQLFQYLGGGVANVIKQINNDFDQIERHIGLFDVTLHNEDESLNNVVQVGPRDNRTRILKGWKHRYLDLKKLKKNRGVTVTISHSPWLHVLNILTGGPDKKVLVLHGPVTYRSKFYEPLLFNLFYFIFDRYTHQYITVSQELNLQVLKYVKNPKKTVCIVNNIDRAEVEKKAAQPIAPVLSTWLQANSVFVSSGRLHPQKNLDFLIALFARLKKADVYKDQKLLIIGEGIQLQYLIETAHKLDLATAVMESGDDELTGNPDVVFTGFLNNPFPLIKHATAYISTSLYEGYPFAVCEAMALGKMLITSDCPTGHLEIITGTADKNYRVGKNRFGILLPIRGMSKLKALNYWTDFMVKHSGYILDNSKEPFPVNEVVFNHNKKNKDKWEQVIYSNKIQVHAPSIRKLLAMLLWYNLFFSFSLNEISAGINL